MAWTARRQAAGASRVADGKCWSARAFRGGRSGSGGCRRQHRGRAPPPLQWPSWAGATWRAGRSYRGLTTGEHYYIFKKDNIYHASLDELGEIIQGAIYR
eukprot:scaffold16412_cov124-Isochrysis_galbana.AAC.1